MVVAVLAKLAAMENEVLTGSADPSKCTGSAAADTLFPFPRQLRAAALADVHEGERV